jgi:hypothetical protein
MAKRLFAVVMIVYLIIDFFLTPFGGLETRTLANVTTTGYATVGLLFVGLALIIASLVSLAIGPRRSSILAIVGALLYFPVFLADYTGQFSTSPVPSAIASLEIVQALVAIVVILVALQSRRDTARSM